MLPKYIDKRHQMNSTQKDSTSILGGKRELRMEVVTVHRVFQPEDKTSKLHSGEIFDQS